MGRPNKIDQNGLAEVVLELAVTKTSRQIAEILKQEHGVEIGHVAVARYIQGMRQERAQATKALVQEHIKATVPKDLELLDAIIEDLRKHYFEEQSAVISDDAGNKLALSDKLAVSREIRQTVATKLRYSGAGEPGASSIEDALDQLSDSGEVGEDDAG